MELGLEPVDVQVPFPLIMGIRDLYVYLLYRLHPSYNLQQDLVAYDHLLHGSVNSWEQIGALGLQGIGSNCMYAMGMLVGAYIIRFVPEVASWLIPGGVSSGTGSVAGSAAMGITTTAGAMAGGAAGSAMRGTGSAVKSLVK